MLYSRITSAGYGYIIRHTGMEPPPIIRMDTAGYYNQVDSLPGLIRSYGHILRMDAQARLIRLPFAWMQEPGYIMESPGLHTVIIWTYKAGYRTDARAGSVF